MKPIRIVITTGDVDGIGSEVAAKALAKIKPSKNIRYIIWRSPSCPKSHLRKMENNFERVTVTSWDQALQHDHDDHKTIIDINSDVSPAIWIEMAAKAALYGHIDAIVTAPLSKTTIIKSGLKDIGHTDILKRVAKRKDVFMAFWGSEMSVVLATGHIPVSEVSPSLTTAKLMKAIRSANALMEAISTKKLKKPIGLLGLNPHAGESGVIGGEEKNYHSAALKKSETEGIKIEGPLVPDVCFQSKEMKKYGTFVANYHDQGLIPFKMLHDEHRGVHLSLGLPFIRTSVDHGTAKDIFNKNKANYYSMLEAIKLAVKITTNQNIKDKLKNI